MIVTSFVYCDHIEVKVAPAPKNQIFSLVDPLQMIAIYTIPGKISFSISIGLQGEEFTIQDNVFYIELKDPDGGVVLKTDPIIVQKADKKDRLPENHGAVLNLDVRNLLFSKRGIYKSFLIDNNGKSIGEFPILVTEESR